MDIASPDDLWSFYAMFRIKVLIDFYYGWSISFYGLLEG